jgi:hypothetical protein
MCRRQNLQLTSRQSLPAPAHATPAFHARMRPQEHPNSHPHYRPPTLSSTCVIPALPRSMHMTTRHNPYSHTNPSPPTPYNPHSHPPTLLGSIHILVPSPAMPRTSPSSCPYSFTATPASDRCAATLGAGRQAVRQAGRQAGRAAGRQAGRHARQAVRQSGRQAGSRSFSAHTCA